MPAPAAAHSGSSAPIRPRVRPGDVQRRARRVGCRHRRRRRRRAGRGRTHVPRPRSSASWSTARRVRGRRGRAAEPLRRRHRAARVRPLRRDRRRRGRRRARGPAVPSIVVAHTVLCDPTPHQRAVLEDVAALADRVVVMTEAARERLCRGFDVDPAKVTTIPHGAAVPAGRARLSVAGRPTLLTWGLLGPGKGIEWAIDAMAMLHDLRPRPRYLVAGAHAPEGARRRRRGLPRRSASSGVAQRRRPPRSLRRRLPRPAVADRADPVVRGRRAALRLARPGHLGRARRRRRRRPTGRRHRVPPRRRAAGERRRASSSPTTTPTRSCVALRRVLTEPGLAAGMAAEAAGSPRAWAGRSSPAPTSALADRLLAERTALV